MPPAPLLLLELLEETIPLELLEELIPLELLETIPLAPAPASPPPPLDVLVLGIGSAGQPRARNGRKATRFRAEWRIIRGNRDSLVVSSSSPAQDAEN